jgi:hypothetical protein
LSTDTAEPSNLPLSSPAPRHARAVSGRRNALAAAAHGLFGGGAPGRTTTLQALLSRPVQVPHALVGENMPDPFAFTVSDPSGNTGEGQSLWMVATSNNLPYAFPLYEWCAEREAFLPALREGRPLSVFPEGQLPSWWNRGEPVPTEPGLPDDLLFARWAPEIFELGEWVVLFYTARDRQGVLRSAYATSRSVEGPWTDGGPLPVNPRARSLVPDYPGGAAGEDPELGTIDGTVVHLEDGGGRLRLALVVKVDGNALRWTDPATGATRCAPTPLVAREFTLDAEGRLHLTGPENVILTDGPQHGGLVEGQFFVRENGHLYVLYSAGFFGNHEYRTYVGKLDDVLHGKVWDERLLMDSESPALAGAWNGPGHPSLERVGEGLYALYLHAWRTGTDYLTHSEQRKALRFHVSFRTSEGLPCEPFVVEDLQTRLALRSRAA